MFKSLRSNKLYIVLGPLALTAPLTSFLRFYDVPFLSPEAFFPFVILFSTGLFAGLIMALGGNLAQALISSVIIIIFACGEAPSTDLFLEGIRFRYIFLLGLFIVGAILYFLGKHRIHFLLILFSVMWLTGTITPNSEKTQVLEKQHQPDTSLPPYIHIILDEHIGIEGVPPSFDKKNYFSHKLKNKYIDQGFLIFGRAYSRFNYTEDSFYSFLNFESSYDPDIYMGTKRNIPNALYEKLNKRGYIINTFSTADIPLCDDSTTYRFGKCISVIGGGLKGYHDGTLILHNFLRKLLLFNIYDVIYKALPPGLGIPKINHAVYPGVLRAVNSANKFIDFLGEGKRGNAYFIHLLLPHQAYLLDEACSYNFDRSFFKNEKWDVVYASYIKQTQCAHGIIDKIINKLDSNHEAQDSTIIIQGDHGSRVPMTLDGTANFENGEYIQFFSTLFSIRSPTVTPGYDRRPFALDELLKASTLSKPDFGVLEVEKEKFVYSLPKRGVFKRYATYQRFTLPPFANGSMTQEW